MIISLPRRHTANSGPRPINLRKDARHVLQLLDVAFGANLDPENRRLLQRSLSLANQSWYLPMFAGKFSPSPGFIWEEDGQIVGNVSLIRAKDKSRFMVANVAVHPSWQRRHIAQQLMQAALAHARSHGAKNVLLQVKTNNDGAINLYQQLGFEVVGTLTYWSVYSSRDMKMPATTYSTPVRQLKRNQWREAYAVDAGSQHPELNWPDPLPLDAYRAGFIQWVDNILASRQVEHWTTHDSKGNISGIATILSQWNKAHTIHIRVLPPFRGQLERTLLAKVLNRLPYLQRRRVRLDHAANDALMNLLLAEAGFEKKRTLVTMKLEI